MGAADDRHLVAARDQRPRELIRARAGRAPRGREMLMEIEEAHLLGDKLARGHGDKGSKPT